MRNRICLSAAFALVVLGGCATVPTGPSVMVLPGTGNGFDQFRADDALCRQFAYESVGGATADKAATDSGLRSAAVGTVVGAAAGAAIGGGRGAAVGAGTGLVVGSAAGAGAAQGSAFGSQQRYDHGYIQCMYAQGHRVPAYGRMMASPRVANPPPPPPGTPPPPPPGVVGR